MAGRSSRVKQPALPIDEKGAGVGEEIEYDTGGEIAVGRGRSRREHEGVHARTLLEHHAQRRLGGSTAVGEHIERIEPVTDSVSGSSSARAVHESHAGAYLLVNPANLLADRRRAPDEDLSLLDALPQPAREERGDPSPLSLVATVVARLGDRALCFTGKGQAEAARSGGSRGGEVLQGLIVGCGDVHGDATAPPPGDHC